MNSDRTTEVCDIGEVAQTYIVGNRREPEHHLWCYNLERVRQIGEEKKWATMIWASNPEWVLSQIFILRSRGLNNSSWEFVKKLNQRFLRYINLYLQLTYNIMLTINTYLEKKMKIIYKNKKKLIALNLIFTNYNQIVFELNFRMLWIE